MTAKKKQNLSDNNPFSEKRSSLPDPLDSAHVSLDENHTPLSFLIDFCLNNKLIVLIFFFLILLTGIYFAPFNWKFGSIERNPVAVDAIPDIGENLQIVFTKWPGRSPQDIEDQVTYPLTVALTGLPGVKSVRSYSMFGFSSIYVIFEDNIDFYWSRTRILEKLNSLPANTLPEGTKPTLGPDSTALGQVYWYTLEGLDENGNPTGGWSLDELRSIQDWTVKFALLSADGVSEVASVGGFVKEYQIDVNPDLMRTYNIGLNQIYEAINKSNRDVGARTIEINRIEYVIRGLGYIKSLADIENSLITERNNVPIFVKDVAKVNLGPAQRRGLLDKEGAETVGGVVVVRYGENPMQVINNLKEKIKELAPSLPRKKLKDGTISQVSIVPFYDRTGLIKETLGTLNSALIQEILITIIVILLIIRHIRVAGLISVMLPATVLICFIFMKLFKVEANIVALSGIAIAIGTIIDMGIVVCENIVKHLEEAGTEEPKLKVIYTASKEVAGAVLTAVSTTVISFLPVFTLQYSEGKLFRPLAFTKTFTLSASVLVALFILPVLSCIFLEKKNREKNNMIMNFFSRIPEKLKKRSLFISYIVIVLCVTYLLTKYWLPLGPEKGIGLNFLFTAGPIFVLLAFFYLFQYYYKQILSFCLERKIIFALVPFVILLWGVFTWLGSDKILPDFIKNTAVSKKVANIFPGLKSEFMPPLDEGAFLYMPSIGYHGSIGEIKDTIAKQDMNIIKIPEVKQVVGKAGRAETPLDPAPIGMVETIINYKDKYISDANGYYLRFKFSPEKIGYYKDRDGEIVKAPDGAPYKIKGIFERDENGKLIPDSGGNVFRQWRPSLDPELNSGRKTWKGIQSPQDIWDEIARVAHITGSTPAYKLQPIETRIVMLQSGMKAKMGVKIKGTSLKAIEKTALIFEKELKDTKGIKPATVTAKRIQGKPYFEIIPDRKALGRYGIKLGDMLEMIEVGIGGKRITSTVEGRERYPVRIRFDRERRDHIDTLKNIPISRPDGINIPLKQLAEIRYRQGAQNIVSEDSFFMTFVSFDKLPGYANSEVVDNASDLIKKRISSGTIKLPKGVFYHFAGEYQNRIRAENRLMLIIPISLVFIFLLLYLQFRSFTTTFWVFTGVAVAWAGGFIMLWLYSCDWFLNFSIAGVDLRELFQIHQINMSVAVWVGFLALFGIATDDGVVMATYIRESCINKKYKNKKDIRNAIITAGERRIRPCLMTTATTILALIPILTATGRGADVMIPMAIPVFGGMLFEIITMLIVPVLYSLTEEIKFKIATR